MRPRLLGPLTAAVILLASLLPFPLRGDPARRADGRYPLFSGGYSQFLGNRVAYWVNARGEIGPNFSCDCLGGGFWPSGSGNSYIFNSGLQVAGIIGGSRPTNPWAGDTTDGRFVDLSGLRQHGSGLTEVFNALLASDLARWPDEGRISAGNPFFPSGSVGSEVVSPGDLWWMSWEGDPGLNAARSHPLGIAVEFRVLGMTAPSGLDDVLFVVATLYNVSAADPSVYQGYPPALRDRLAALGAKFKADNDAKFGVTLPAAGYTIAPLHANLSVDPDVTSSSGTNIGSVNLPLAMGFAYHPDFPRAGGWTFPPELFGPPFFSGAGLVGTKWLRTGPAARPEILLFSDHTGGGAFPDPNTAVRNFKYMSATIGPQDGVACNQGGPLEVTHICYVGNSTPSDVRFMQSTPATSLAPGASLTVAWAYVHAAPVAIPGYVRGTRVLPGNPTRLTQATQLALGANRIDSIAGFTGFVDRNGDGLVQQEEISAVRRSLIDKAQVAQAMFDRQFRAPAAPAAPDFYLIPGDRSVTIVWRPSTSESAGDPYFDVAASPVAVPTGGGPPAPNPLYDPNYRRFDVEGYRIWRGRTNDPGQMQLLAQYDYAGTVLSDYTASVVTPALGSQCAPELGLIQSCATLFELPAPGVALVKHVDRSIAGDLVQVAPGDRTVLPGDDVFVIHADTAVTGGASGYPRLADTDVPFSHVDHDLRNGLSYTYAVTAFDVNSIASTGAGRTSLESPRIVKLTVPRGDAIGAGTRDVVTEQGIYGRHGRLPEAGLPTIDPVTGKFSGRFPPANGISMEVVGLVPQLVADGAEVAVTFDSSRTTAFQSATSIQATYYYSLTTRDGTTRLAVPVTQSSTTGVTSTSAQALVPFADPERLARFGIGGEPPVAVSHFSFMHPPGYYLTVRSRGCVNHASGYSSITECAYNGPRWFEGDAESVSDPNASNPDYFNTGLSRLAFNNVGGGLAGVRTIFEPRAYDDYSNSWRDVETVLMPFASAADYRVYWGTAGAIDSVIDLTHDVVVPFSEQLGPSWGILNRQATQNGATYYDQRAELTVTDVGCIEPIRSLDPGGVACSGSAAALSRVAVPSTIAFGSASSTTVDRTAPAAQGAGFVLYLKGHFFMVELNGIGFPPAGRAWTMRDYVGAISGGNGRAGNGGEYQFTTQEQPRPFTAVGSTLRLRTTVTTRSEPVVAADLARVHTVPDPYYGPAIDAGAAPDGITFVNLPDGAVVRIYSTSGVLLRVLRHDDPTGGGDRTWDLRNREGRRIATGLYFYHVTAPGGAAAVGRMTVVRQ